MKRELLLMLAVTGSLCGCGTIGSAERMAAQPLPELCDRYSRTRDAGLWQLIDSRAGFSDAETAAIADGRVYAGMSENALICAWGIPGHHGGVSKRITDGGSVYKQYFYVEVDARERRYKAPRSVVLLDGRVVTVYD